MYLLAGLPVQARRATILATRAQITLWTARKSQAYSNQRLAALRIMPSISTTHVHRAVACIEGCSCAEYPLAARGTGWLRTEATLDLAANRRSLDREAAEKSAARGRLTVPCAGIRHAVPATNREPL